MAAAKRPKGMPAGIKNTPANRKEFRKLTSKKAGGALPQRTKAQAARVRQAEGAARKRSAKADAAAAKARAGGKAVGAKRSDKLGRAQAKARRLASSAGGAGG